jgi:hypothetical protein
LVRGTRIPYEEAEVLVEEIIQEELPKSNWEEMYMLGIWLGVLVVLVIALIAIIVLIVRNKRQAKRRRRRKGGRYVRT